MAGPEITFKTTKTGRRSFRGFDPRFIEALMEDEARRYQNEVAQYMGSNFRRPGESSGRLQRVTRDSGNRIVTPRTWRVGIPGYLNRSEAKYWRLIEQGSAGLYGRGKGFANYPLLYRGGSGFSGGRNFRSMPKYNKKTKMYSSGAGPTRAHIITRHKEIMPMNAYRTVFDRNGWRERIRRDFTQSVRKSFLR